MNYESFWESPEKIGSQGVIVHSTNGMYKLWYDGQYYFYWRVGDSMLFAYKKIDSLYDLDRILTELSIGYTFGGLNKRLEEVGLKIPLNYENPRNKVLATV